MEIIHEEAKMEQELVISRPPELSQSYPWLVICDREENSDRQIFYSILEDRYEIRLIPELQNKKISCNYGEWLVLKDNYTHDCSLLNILTMENLQLPPLEISQRHQCVLLPREDGGWLIFFLEGHLYKASSCHLSDKSEFFEHDLTIIENDLVLTATSFEGKLYAVTMFYHLYVVDISGPYIELTPVIDGGSVENIVSKNGDVRFYLVESSGELLFVFMNYWHNKVVDIKIFKADFDLGEWVRLDRIGDRSIFLDASYGYSSPASANGLKHNSIYLVNTDSKILDVYDIEDQSFSMSVPCPRVDSMSVFLWMSVLSEIFGCSYPSSPEQRWVATKKVEEILEVDEKKRWKEWVFPTNLLCEIFSLSRYFYSLFCNNYPKVERLTYRRQGHYAKKTSWSDLPSNLMCEIFSRLLPRDRVAFQSVSKSWKSIGNTTTQRMNLECSYPSLLFSNNRIFHPIYEDCHHIAFPCINSATVLCGPSYDKFHRIDFLDIPGALVRVVKDGWLLISQSFDEIFFFNPLTKEKVHFPRLDGIPMCMYFSSPPTSPDWVVVVGVYSDSCDEIAIQTMKCGGDSWSYSSCFVKGIFKYSYCNILVFKGLYYLLGEDAQVLIHNPETKKFYFPKPIQPTASIGEQYMMVTDDEKLLGVFVGPDGSSICLCQWSLEKERWETLESLDDKVLFVSHLQSVCTRAIRRGAGNRIYFPRLVGSHCLFYSLNTKRLQTSTFAMDTCYRSFVGSKEYRDATWIVDPSMITT